MAKRIWLHVVNSMHGGVGRVVENLVTTGLEGFEQKICRLDGSGASRIVSAGGKLLAARRAIRSLPSGSIAHLHCGLRSWLYARPQRGVRCITTIHGMVGPRGLEVPRDILELRLLSRRPATIVSVSRHCGETMKHMAGRAFPITVLPNGVPEASTAAPMRRADNLHIGFVGDFSWNKGIHIFLEVARILDGARVKFVVFGDGPRSELVATAARQGLIRWFRNETDPRAIYPRMDVLLFPSQPRGPDVTGCPMVLLEAKSFGVPVVASSIPGAAELIEDDGDGILVAGFRPHDYAAEIEELMGADQKRREFSIRARQRWSLGFTAGLMARRYLRLASELDGGRL
ncbi:MAG: glycosyltransferase family 4 protein [Syntrophobacteraceae bacterium]|nr:glycosyltransferase family 4 protein [Syntrophobacteraceae bacterium]